MEMMRETLFAIALKNAVLAAAVAGPLSMITGTELSINFIAAGAAALGQVARWIWFKLSRRDGVVGLAVLPVMAFFFARLHPPIIDSFIGNMSPENYAGLLGFALGMFPTALGGYIQDIWIAKRKPVEAPK
jgi:hypothetical protein